MSIMNEITGNFNVRPIGGDKYIVSTNAPDYAKERVIDEDGIQQLKEKYNKSVDSFEKIPEKNKDVELSEKDLKKFGLDIHRSERVWYDITDKHELNGNGMKVLVKDGLNGRYVRGVIEGKEVNLKLSGTSLFYLDKGNIQGTIDGKEVSIKYEGTENGFRFKNVPSDENDIIMHLGILAVEKVSNDVEKDNAIAAGAIMSGKA